MSHFLFDKSFLECYTFVKMMIGVDKMTNKKMANKKRVGIILNVSVYDKLQHVAVRYGMTVNSLMAYVLGQWADGFDVKEKLTD